ncbi:uncharacterized protein LOC144470903 [Augochlora pura]
MTDSLETLLLLVMFAGLGTMTTLKKDEKRATKKSPKTASQKAPGRNAKTVKPTKQQHHHPVKSNDEPENSEDASNPVVDAEAARKKSGKFERKSSFRWKIGSLIRGSAAELPAAINRGLQPIKRSLSFSKDLNRLHEPSKPSRGGSAQWYNSLVSLAEDECLAETPPRSDFNTLSTKVTRTQSLIDTTTTTDSVNDQPTLVRQRKARSAENIAAVRESVQENPRQSIPRRAQELGLSQSSTWRILRLDLGLHLYKIHLTQKLKVNDHRQRHFFLWGFLKSQVYTSKPRSTDALKVNIAQTIAQIQPELCGKVIDNWSSPIRATVQSRWGRLNDVIFHI